MAIRLDPYLSFRDNAREVMEFYRGVLGGELTISTFAEYHASDDPAEAEKVMHASLTTADGLLLMAADTPNGMDLTPGDSMSLSLSGDDEAKLRGYFDALAEGGTIIMPLGEAPWGAVFGMCTDRYGVNWMVNVDRT